MVFVFKTLFLSALVYTANCGLLHDHHDHIDHHGHHDSYVSSALNAPSASYGAPSGSYGPPAISAPSHTQAHFDHGHSDGGLISGPSSFPSGSSGPIDVSGSGLSGPGLGPSGGPYQEGSLLQDATLPPRGQVASSSTQVGAPRVIGTTVTVGRPIASASRYELQQVVQDVIRRVPVEVTRHVQVAVPHPVPVPVRQEVRVPVPQPYPVHVDVVKHVPYPVYKTEHVEVERPVPYEVVKEVPFEVIRKVPVPIERPYEVIKKIHVPIEKAVEVPVPIWKPYPIHIIKHVTHYQKKSCCW